jgi:hypothetical protein
MSDLFIPKLRPDSENLRRTTTSNTNVGFVGFLGGDEVRSFERESEGTQ